MAVALREVSQEKTVKPQTADTPELDPDRGMEPVAGGQLRLAFPFPAGHRPEVVERCSRGRQPEAGAAARRSTGGQAGGGLLGLLGVVLLTPLVLLAGLVALIGLVAIGTTRRLRSGAGPPERSQLAAVVCLEGSASEIPLSRAA